MGGGEEGFFTPSSRAQGSWLTPKSRNMPLHLSPLKQGLRARTDFIYLPPRGNSSIIMIIRRDSLPTFILSLTSNHSASVGGSERWDELKSFSVCCACGCGREGREKMRVVDGL